MKKILLTAALLSIFLSATSQPWRTFRNEISIGGGVSYRLGIKEEFSNPGLNLEGNYSITEEFRAGIDATYYVVDGNFSPSAFDVNINGNGLFYIDNDWQIYVLAGAQFIWIDYDWGEAFGNKPHSGFGFNIGGGAEHEIDDFRIFAQPKVTIYSFNTFRSTLQFTLGVRYVF